MKGHILVTGGAGYIGSHTCKALKQAGMKFEDVHYWEINEAFASQFLGCGIMLKNDYGMVLDMERCNINGSGIALGHPVGASGARILVTLLYAMKHRGAHKGLATLCIGGGMGCATIVEM